MRITLPPAPPNHPRRGRIGAEIAIVLALGLGQSAVYSIVQLTDRLTQSTRLADQSATLNPAQSNRELFDLLYQLLGIGFSVVPAVLACFLLWRPTRPHLAALGVDGSRLGRESGYGILLVLVIGIPGLALYIAGRMTGLFVAVDPGAQSTYAWTIPMLLLSAARASVQEEFVVLGYLFARLRQLGWGPWPIIIATSILRATYHLYQGPGAFLGNLGMGLVFGFLFLRSGRLWSFLVAHFLINAIVFVGYPVAAGLWPALFSPASR